MSGGLPKVGSGRALEPMEVASSPRPSSKGKNEDPGALMVITAIGLTLLALGAYLIYLRVHPQKPTFRIINGPGSPPLYRFIQQVNYPPPPLSITALYVAAGGVFTLFGVGGFIYDCCHGRYTRR